MKILAHLWFWVIVVIALAVSGYATYEVLTGTVGIQTYIALAAAVVIDTAAIWMGHHTTVLAKLGDSTHKAKAATWFIIGLSLAVNFYHGYVAGSWAGAFVGIIFPLLAAILFEFYISHTIRETKRARGEILPAKPVWIKRGKYRDKEADARLERDFVTLTRDRAAIQMKQLRDSFETPETTRETEIDLSLTDETTTETSETAQRDSETSPVSQRDTDETASLVNGVFAAQMLRDINETMTIKEIVEVLVGQGIKDYEELETKINEVRDKPVSRATIRKTASRVLRDSETKE